MMFWGLLSREAYDALKRADAGLPANPNWHLPGGFVPTCAIEDVPDEPPFLRVVK